MLKWCLWNQDATLDGCCWELPQALLLFFSFLGFFPPLFTFPVGVVKKQAVGGCGVRKVLAWELPGMVFKLFRRSLEQFVENTKVSNVRVCWHLFLITALGRAWVVEKSHQWKGRQVLRLFISAELFSSPTNIPPGGLGLRPKHWGSTSGRRCWLTRGAWPAPRIPSWCSRSSEHWKSRWNETHLILTTRVLTHQPSQKQTAEI